ncbi:MAG TPA: metallophosphoesterase [Spirochaetales bacterium]|nr:metallophosphoesterase [Spirochaetales bacterium]
MKPSQPFRVRFLAFAAAALAALLLFRLMHAPGTLGLLVWNPSYRSFAYGILALGAVPFLLAIVYEVLRGIPSFRRRRAAGLVSMGVSAVSGAAALAAILFLAIAPNRVPDPLPTPRILDPSRGIVVRPSGDGGPYLRLAFSSDPHWGREQSDEAARTRILTSVDAGDYDAFFLLGDISEQGFPESGFREAALDLETYLTRVPVRPMMGNHDALVNAAGRWARYFFPSGHSSDSGSPLYYRIDAGRAHILVLNLLWGEEDFDHAQRAWLTEQLESIPRQDAVVVLSHCYFYASGYDDPESGSPWYDHPGTIREVVPLLETYGVDLAVSGHNHYQELLEHNGVTYAVIGAMGGVPDPAPTYRSPASRWIRVSTFGFLEARFYPDRIELAFRDAAGGELHRAVVSAE